jgi:glutamate carboxypeptidase
MQHPSPIALELLRDSVARRQADFLRQLETLVNIDSGSYSPAGVNRIADFCAASLTDLGAEVERIGHDRYGDLVIGRLAGDGTRILLIGHMDTVFAEGTAEARPFRVKDGRAHGPGVTDMKAGLLAGMHALAALREQGGRPSVTYVCNPDEEIGSPFSTPHIRQLVPEHDVAFILECARANGDVVSARKGTADLHITIAGTAAHAGVEPEKGRSAILAAARLIEALHGLNGQWPGVTVNVGVVEGGTRPNVVAERCLMKVDVRATTAGEMEAATKAIEELGGRTWVGDTTTTIRRVSGHAPMERSTGNEALLALARRVGSELGFEIRGAATGGASDANTTAGMGLPTLDGLGPIGGDDHSADEWLDLASVVPRVTLLAGLIDRAGRRRDDAATG